MVTWCHIFVTNIERSLKQKIYVHYIVSGILAVVDITEEMLLLCLYISNLYNQQCNLVSWTHEKSTEISYLFEN